jgi:hypothetical protein
VSRPVDVDLTVPHERWRDVPMPASNLPLRLVRLAAGGDTFAIYARFPAGFERDVAGGYEVDEEFLVLDGSLHLDGAVHRRGDLTHVPAREVRASMSAPEGCTVLAWFGGPADFVPASGLSGPADGRRRTVRVVDADPGELLALPAAVWSVRVRAAAGDDVLDLELRHWWRGQPAGGSGPFLVRSAR